MEYAYVTTDEDGNDQVVTRGEYKAGLETLDVGATVTLEGPDGVERPWRIMRKIPVPYAGEKIYVEPVVFD